MCGNAASEEARKIEETLSTLLRAERGSDSEDERIEVATKNRPSDRAEQTANLQILTDSANPPKTQTHMDHKHGPADVPQMQLAMPRGRAKASVQAQRTQYAVEASRPAAIDLTRHMPDDASPGTSNVTMDITQPTSMKITADGVYAEWQQQGMTTSAIITLAAEVQLLAIQLSEKSDDRIHVLRVARALIDAHDLPFSSVDAGTCLSCSPGTKAPSTAIAAEQSDASSSAKHHSRCSRVDSDTMARDAIQSGDISMQTASDIIHSLPIKQRRIGIKYMALGRQQFRGQQFAAANRKYPHVLEYLQSLIAVAIPQLDASQVCINVVRGTTSEWHTDPPGQRSFVCTPAAQSPVMLQYRTTPAQSTVGHFVEVDSTRQHRVLSDQQCVSLAIYWQEQTPKVTQQWIDVAVRYGDIHAMQRHRLARHDDVNAIQQKVLDKLGIYLPEGWTIHTVAKTGQDVVRLDERQQVQPHDQLAVTIVPGCTRRLPLPTFQGGGGDEQVGKQLQKMKEADCRYTVAQRKAILA
eukprot:14394-Amphidinium_carterae.1